MENKLYRQRPLSHKPKENGWYNMVSDEDLKATSLYFYAGYWFESEEEAKAGIMNEDFTTDGFEWLEPCPPPLLPNLNEAVQEYAQDFKELSLYLDDIYKQMTSGDKDAGNLWIQFTDKFNAFRKKVIAGVNSTNHVPGEKKEGLTAEQCLNNRDINIDRWPDTKHLIILAMEDYRNQPNPVPSIPTDLVKRLAESNPWQEDQDGQCIHAFRTGYNHCVQKVESILKTKEEK